MSEKHAVLFVCEANVCRSAMMEAVFRAAVPGAAWRVSSAGTRVVAHRLSMCEVSAAVSDVDPRRHVARQVDAAMLRDHDLVITASRAERAALGAMAPTLRWRTFTLREALILSGGLADGRGDAGVDGHLSILERYASALHRRRGIVDVPRTRRRFPVGREPDDPLDLPDVHGARLSRHRSVLDAGARDVRTLAGRLREAVAQTPPSS